MKNYYWTVDSFGSGYLPENWQDLIAAANQKIDDFIRNNNMDPGKSIDYDEICNYSETLFETMTNNDYTARAQQIIENGLYNTAVELMDNELREAIHSEFAPCTDLEFLVEYMTRHKEKFGIDFVI